MNVSCIRFVRVNSFLLFSSIFNLAAVRFHCGNATIELTRHRKSLQILNSERLCCSYSKRPLPLDTAEAYNANDCTNNCSTPAMRKMFEIHCFGTQTSRKQSRKSMGDGATGKKKRFLAFNARIERFRRSKQFGAVRHAARGCKTNRFLLNFPFSILRYSARIESTFFFCNLNLIRFNDSFFFSTHG